MKASKSLNVTWRSGFFANARNFSAAVLSVCK
jgi:hypothetical protein